MPLHLLEILTFWSEEGIEEEGCDTTTANTDVVAISSGFALVNAVHEGGDWLDHGATNSGANLDVLLPILGIS